MSSTGPTDRPRSSTIGTSYDPTARRLKHLEDRYRELWNDHRELKQKHRDLEWAFKRLITYLTLFAILSVGTGVILGVALLTP